VGRWAWSKVGEVHTSTGGCTGEVRTYHYRLYPPTDSRFERCVGLGWCSICREYCGNVVFVGRDVELHDVLAGLPHAERERTGRSEVRLLDWLDRLARRDEY
jgi:hypothetical protein